MDAHKKIALINTFSNAGLSIASTAKAIPVTRKSKRNIFLKTYQRRPLNKQKRTQSFTQMMMMSVMAAAQARIIISQPSVKDIGVAAGIAVFNKIYSPFAILNSTEDKPITIKEQMFKYNKNEFIHEGFRQSLIVQNLYK